MSSESRCNSGLDDKKSSSSWGSFLKSVATFKGDIASITAPPFLLSHQSIVEFSTYWAEHPSLLVAPASESDPAKRALLVLKWFLSTLKQQHSNRDDDGKKKKLKPLNPFLGELFLGSWQDEAGVTKLVSEQVSHHPPATAFNLWNDEHGMQLTGHIIPKVYFSSTIHIDRKGYALMRLDKFDEEYLITMPAIHVEGLLTGTLSPELSGRSHIRSSTGYTATVDYSSKGWLRGKKNTFTASICHDSKPNTAIYTADGQWSDIFTLRDAQKQTIETVDMNQLQRTPLTVAPLDQQGALESRRAWAPVADAIRSNDMFATGKHKSAIEVAQREMRKQEKAEQREYERTYFSRAPRDEAVEALIRSMGPSAEAVAMQAALGDGVVSDSGSGEKGVWLWDAEKYRCAKKDRGPLRVSFDSGISGMSA